MDNSLQNKLTSFEETPPAGVWNKIAEALDEEENFAQRLYNYSQSPPSTIWNGIEKSLDGETSTAKIIPFKRRVKKSIRFVVAASILGLIVIASIFLLRGTEKGNIQAGSTGTVPAILKPIVPSQGQNNPASYPLASSPALTVIESTTKQTTLKRKFLNFIQPQGRLRSVAVARKFIPGNVIKEALFSSKSIDNYMVFSDGDGMAMRVPKKLFPLVQCQDGDGSCRQRIKSLQQKISSASLTTDFGAVIEMLHQVQ